jgi:hypothetical protein
MKFQQLRAFLIKKYKKLRNYIHIGRIIIMDRENKIKYMKIYQTL